ncbi:MAG: Stk1 family PASTA domain-containing Ser/Thr kinase [Suipraeoptans sp.]
MANESNNGNGNNIVLGERYQVISKIGTGGMADVYKGKDLMLNRFIAIKVLKKEFRVEADFVAKFKSEAQAAAGLSNPNIVNVYDVGEDRGLNYMVMELVDGITLKEYIRKKGKLSYKEAISIAIQTCQGIGAAHAADIIHRDIKPQNIMISQEGKVKVTDFGIAKALSSNTMTSNAMGSVHYTSPEQARGGYSDVRSDIYSIGITMYEMVTGEVPFDGESTVAVAMQHLQKDMPYPSDIVPDIPYSLEQIIMKCTLKSGERRYASTTDLIKDLKHSLVDPEGDFVVIPPISTADTVMLTDSDLDDVRRHYNDMEDDDYDDDDYDDDSFSETQTKRGKNGNINPKMSKMMKILTIVVAVIILFILIFVVGQATGIFKGFGSGNEATESDDQVKVPDLIGMTEDEVAEALDGLEIGYKVTSQEESEKYDAGQVISQDPEAGEKIDKNKTVNVVLSSGKAGEKAKIPSIEGMSEEDAQKALQTAGLTNINWTSANSSTVDSGHVISVTPGVGSEVEKDEQITVVISLGVEQQSVPNVVGYSESDARSAIESVGFAVGSVSYQADSSASGTVLSQSPTGGKKDPGTKISLVISKGPEMVNVPSIVGKTLTQATQALSNVGLSVGGTTYAFSDSVDQGKVISADPGDGSSVTVGTSVNLVISDGPEGDTGDEDTGTNP